MPRWRNFELQRFFPAAIVLLTLLAFLPSLANDFVNWDDETNFLRNSNFRGLGWGNLEWMWSSHLLGRYVPIAWMTLGLDYCIWGMRPFGYHLTSILWHAANGVIFYFLAIALFRRVAVDSARIPFGALCAALIFALHPLRVESVAWVTERRDVVSGFFYLLAILVYVRGVPADAARPIERKHYWGSLGLFALAILSKEIAVTLPVVLLILDAYPLRRLKGARVWLEKIPFFALSAVSSVATLYIGYHDKLAEPLAHVTLFDRLAIVVYGLALYLRKTVLPFRLSQIYALTPERTNLLGAPFLWSAFTVIAIAAAVYLLRRRVPALWAVALAYAVTLIPVSGLFHNGRQIAADRYSYLSCLGWALLIGAVFLHRSAQAPARKTVVGIAVALAFALAALTWRQTHVWRDSDTLWAHALEIESSYVTHTNMGNLLAQEGDMLWAIDHLRRATALKPDYSPAHLNLGTALLAIGRPADAASEFRKVLELGENREFAENGLGAALASQGNFNEAIPHFEAALRIDPEFRDAHRNLDEARARQLLR